MNTFGKWSIMSYKHFYRTAFTLKTPAWKKLCFRLMCDTQKRWDNFFQVLYRATVIHITSVLLPNVSVSWNNSIHSVQLLEVSCTATL